MLGRISFSNIPCIKFSSTLLADVPTGLFSTKVSSSSSRDKNLLLSASLARSTVIKSEPTKFLSAASLPYL